MNGEVCSKEEFAALWKKLGSARKVADHLGIDVRAVYARRNRIEEKLSISLDSFDIAKEATARVHRARVPLNIQDGIVLVASDAHFWPEIRTTAFRALLHFLEHMRPRPVAMILNGDMFDGATISRHPKIGFMEKAPSVQEELQAVEERLTEIEDVLPPGCEAIWTLGNHDLRYESFLAAHAPQYEGVHGLHLKDKFPRWKPCWGVHINEGIQSYTVIKHRWHNGTHATHNNVIKAGVNIVTGHLHAPNYKPWSDYTGTRYGIDCGTLAEPYSEQFVNYTEDGPVNWRSAFAVLTYSGGRLLLPEFVQRVDDERVEFRGNVIEV